MSFVGPAGLAGLGRPTAPAGPAAETQRLLNSYANHMLALENEAHQVKGKQQAAQVAYGEALQLLTDSKALLLRADAEVAALDAEAAQRERDVHAKAAVTAHLGEQARQRKAEVDSIHALADAQRASFFQECEKLAQELRSVTLPS